MDIQFIKLGVNPKNELNDTVSNHNDLILESNDVEVSGENKNKISIKNCDFITLNNPNDELLNKSELEISTSEFIIDEDNFNISPNASSDPCVDPLAIDDFNVEEIATSLNDSQFSLAKDNIIYIVDVDDIKENSTINPTINSIKISSIEDIQKKLSKNKKDGGINIHSISQNRDKSENNDENEMPSDGSDSGLGLESNLQLDNYHKLHNTITISEKKIPTKSSLKRRSDTLEETILPPIKRGKKSIQFDNVKIFYFPRVQGFCCIPSQGGCTLGMGAKHVQSKTYKLSDHVTEQNGDEKLSMQLCNTKGSSSDETDSDEDLSEENISDLDPDSSGFLQPVPVKTRRQLLKSAGIKKIDSTEKDDCRAIRSSREYCGCLCRGFCDPDTCSCSQSGIKCQVDRPNFPCGCSRDGCANIHGRIEFNPGRVRTHFIHTIMRLEIENKSKPTFIHEIPTNHRFFPNSNPGDVIYGSESHSRVQTSLQFFPDTISGTNNDNNFDLFPLHNGEESTRIALSASVNDIIEVGGELSYPVLKSFLSPTNNFPNDETDCSKALKLSRNNNIKSSTCISSDINEAKYLGSYAQAYESFSSAYTNFLEEAYQPSKALFTERSNGEITELNSSSLHYNQNSLEISSVHDLLNINRNNTLPYPINGPEIVSTTNDITKNENNSQVTNLDNISSITKHCILAPTAHTSTSIFEGTSTSVSNYVPSSCNFETKDVLKLTTDSTITTVTNTISKCDFSEPIKIESKNSIEKLEENIFLNTDLENEISQCEFKEEILILPFSSPPPSTITEISNKTTQIIGPNIVDTKDGIKKQYQSFNLTSSCSSTITANNNNDELNGTLFNIPSSTNVELLKDIK